MDEDKNIKAEELWVNAISRCLGTKLKVTEEQKGVFARSLEIIIPEMSKLSEITHPKREEIKFLKEKADKLVDLLESIKIASEKSSFVADIIDFSLAHKAHRMDFKDVYWFTDAFQGFLQDELDKIKPGPDVDKELSICLAICQTYERVLGSKPTCRDQNYITLSSDVSDATPYEQVCWEVNRRYMTDLKWSSMRKAKQTYKEYFTKKKLNSDFMDKI